MGFGSPQEDRGANVEPPHTGRAEQMAQRIMKIQLCSLLGKLSLQVGEAVPPNCAQNSQPPKTAYAKRLPVWRLWSPRSWGGRRQPTELLNRYQGVQECGFFIGPSSG